MNEPAEKSAAQAFDRGFQLGALHIEPATGAVSGPAGVEKLDPKVMAVLVVLAERAGQVVSREDLLSRIWPNVVVTDEALSRCIYELRRQLSLAGGGEEFKLLVETLPKRGYRLNGEITPLAAPASAPWDRGRRRATPWVVAACVLSVIAVFGYLRMREPPAMTGRVAGADNSIAVLPFVDLSEHKDQGYFGDGIAEEILNRLAQSNDLRVIARTSSFALRNETLDIPTIAQKLRVSHVLEGSVRKSGDRIRVTAQLVQGTDGAHLWSETFDRGVSDVFVIQDEISSSVATALRITLASSAPEDKAPASVEAYENFLKGDFFYFRRSPGDIERAVSNFKAAIALDPRYSKAWAGLSAAYGIQAWDGVDVNSELQRLQGEAALKAVELDPQSAIAQIRLAMFYTETGQHEKAAEHNRIALEVDPDHAIIHSDLVWHEFNAGNVDKAIELMRRNVSRDPLSRVDRQNFGALLLASKRFDEARSEYKTVLELDPNAGSEIQVEFVRLDVLQGRYSQAYARISRLSAGKHRDYGLALLYRVPEHRAESDAAFERFGAQQGDVSESVGEDLLDELMLAEVQAYRGMKDDAFATLTGKKQALVRKWGTDVPVVWYMQHEAKLSPFLIPLHDDPRWQEFLSSPEAEPG